MGYSPTVLSNWKSAGAGTLLALSMLSGAWAATPPSVATVEAVQSPAFLVRGGRTEPLAPGMALRNGDQIRTGEQARTTLRLAEGSAVKLGESAQMTVYNRSLKPQVAFKGALDVLAGAFRFTTGALSKLRSKRDLSIRVGTATIGIRGTDVWGRSNQEKDLVCLIEGHVEIKHPALAEPVDMPQAMSFFVAPKGAAPEPVAPVDPAQLKQWARETEIEPGDGAIRRDGRWALRIGDARSEADALDLYDQLREEGFVARIRPVAAEKGWAYEVRVPGFASAAEAEATARRIKAHRIDGEATVVR